LPNSDSAKNILAKGEMFTSMPIINSNNYWSHGPHYQIENSVYFITWRLAFSLPKKVLDIFSQLTRIADEQEREQELTYLQQKDKRVFAIFMEYDEGLATIKPPDFSLTDNEIGNIVTRAFHYLDHNKYNLHSYCVMSNHIHILLNPLKNDKGIEYPVFNIIQSLKRVTANQINKHRSTTGQVWDDYYFDRIIRSVENYSNVLNYIMMNPVKAGLIDRPEEWIFSYYNSELISGYLI